MNNTSEKNYLTKIIKKDKIKIITNQDKIMIVMIVIIKNNDDNDWKKRS